jgi:hypothetical protein
MDSPVARTSPKTWRRVLALLAAVCVCGAALAARETRPFAVTVRIASEGATCDSSSAGSSVSVGCQSVGQPTTNASLPLLFMQVFRGGQLVGDIHSGMSSGTITSWRVVRGNTRDYLEIMVAW